MASGESFQIERTVLELLHSLEELDCAGSRPEIVLVIGAFDGVHLAHQALIRGAVARARALDRPALVLSFNPHPDSVVRPDRPMIYLTDLEDKAALIAGLGVDSLIIQPFTFEFSQLTAEEFIELLLSAARLREIHVGTDFVFGHKAQGNVLRLREWGLTNGFEVHVMQELEIDGEPVSSSRIRRMLLEGYVEQAARLLGRRYSLKGQVIHGNARGRLLGFPTANMAVAPDFATPAHGVYASFTTFLDQADEGPHPSITNIGTRPTFDNGVRSVETFVLDWSGVLYGQAIRVEFVQKLRDERKFAGIDEIRAQLELDVAYCRQVLQAAVQV